MTNSYLWWHPSLIHVRPDLPGFPPYWHTAHNQRLKVGMVWDMQCCRQIRGGWTHFLRTAHMTSHCAWTEILHVYIADLASLSQVNMAWDWRWTQSATEKWSYSMPGSLKGRSMLNVLQVGKVSSWSTGSASYTTFSAILRGRSFKLKRGHTA